jgi:pimeloyl-ACP methyl ester carboxylesterase
MSPSTTLVQIPGDRRVAVESYGDPNGKPVFFFHGWPSSRFQGALGHEGANELGVHLLAVDRPGCGQSDLHLGRTLRDWPELLSGVADHFGFSQFHVLGVSGGGPYALASAWGLPERVVGAAVVSGAPPLAERADISKLMPVYQMLLWAYRRTPEVVRGLFRVAGPISRVRPPAWLWRGAMLMIPECDRVALSDQLVLDRAWAGYSGAWVGHPDGVFHDARIYAAPWGFDLAEIRVPVRLWHGREDRNFQWQLAEELANHIPDCTARMIDGEGHYSLIMRCHREILSDLISPRGSG